VPDHPFFARFYDRLTARTERAGLADMRHRLLSSASGRVLELGAGTGHNLEHYTDAVTELVLAEPDPNMAKLLRERLEREGTPAGSPSVIEAPAEDLPFDDGSFDVVVATLVLCTVENPVRAVAEARRVLVEGFWIDSLERDKLPKAPPLVRPVIHGVAIRPSGVGGD